MFSERSDLDQRRSGKNESPPGGECACYDVLVGWVSTQAQSHRQLQPWEAGARKQERRGLGKEVVGYQRQGFSFCSFEHQISTLSWAQNPFFALSSCLSSSPICSIPFVHQNRFLKQFFFFFQKNNGLTSCRDQLGNDTIFFYKKKMNPNSKMTHTCLKFFVYLFDLTFFSYL